MVNNPFKRKINNLRHHYCQILGVGDNATDKEIKEAFDKKIFLSPRAIQIIEGRGATEVERKRWKQICSARWELCGKKEWEETESELEERRRLWRLQEEEERLNQEQIELGEQLREYKRESEEQIREFLWKSDEAGIRCYDRFNEKFKKLFKERIREAFSSLSSPCSCKQFILESTEVVDISFFSIHTLYCLSTRQEVEEFVQGTIKIAKEMNEKLCRMKAANINKDASKDVPVIPIETKEEEKKTNIDKNRLNQNSHELLEDILETQKELVRSNFDNSFIQNQLERFKQRLLNNGQINQAELNKVCQFQAELSFLELKLEQEQRFQVQFEVRQEDSLH